MWHQFAFLRNLKELILLYNASIQKRYITWLKLKPAKKGGRMSDTEHKPACGNESKTKEPVGMDLEDMVHLVYIMDAYRKLNITCCGEEIMMGFDEGCIGVLSRIYKVIEHNACENMRKDDFKKGDKILLDDSLTPEERAKKLLGK